MTITEISTGTDTVVDSILDTSADTAAGWIDTWQRASPTFALVALDLYRDIHKGIRCELFSAVERAGSVDPHQREDVLALVDHVRATRTLLESHAHHEDEAIQPVLDIELPQLAERIERDHLALDRTIGRLADMASSIRVDGPDVRRDVHLLYLDLGRFVSEYLVHIDIEERVLMPALDRAIGFDATLAVHAAILGAIAPEDMAKSLALMLPAMNVEDRCELLGGMQADAPPEVFDGVIGLAASVLRPDDFRVLRGRLGLS
jgi:iron-sulfur cluster repair protein YtfE (RIC family)